MDRAEPRLLEVLMDALAREIEGRECIAIESGKHTGQVLLQMLTCGLLPDAGDRVHAFIAAEDTVGQLVAPWAARQMHTHVLLPHAGSTPSSPLDRHSELIVEAARLGFKVFLCAAIPGGSASDTLDAAQLSTAGTLTQVADEADVELRFPWLRDEVRSALPVGAQTNASDVFTSLARSWVGDASLVPDSCLAPAEQGRP